MNAHSFGETGNSLPRPDMSIVNERGIEVGRSQMEQLCTETVDLIFDGVAAALEVDRELFERLTHEGFPEGEAIGSYVKQDTHVTAPPSDEDFTRTFYTRLEPDTTNVTNKQLQKLHREGEPRYMHVHVPAGELEIGEFRMPSRSEVKEVYIEIGNNDYTQWFGIARSGMIYEYEPPRYQSGSDALDMAVWNDYYDRVPEAMQTVTKLFRKVVNWRTTPQDFEIISYK